VGCKTNSQGHKDYWIGYKLHVRVDEAWCLPLAAVTTAASVHDSQVAIPLMKLSDRRCRTLYELMDRAYDAATIRQAAELAGHVPIIDYIRRRGQARATELAPDRAEHYKDRTVVERFNARLKDEFGGDMVRVRGHRKVHAHLMCAVLVIFADQLLRLAT
jgi:IS5 family transposase